MASAPVKFIACTLCSLSLLCLSHSRAAAAEEQTTSVLPHASEPWAVTLDLGWDSAYLSQGRDNLQHSGIYWAYTEVQQGNFTTYALMGRGDNQAYTEWNLGLEYALAITEHLEAHLGYQRIEAYSDSRCRDNEFFAELAYTAVPWLVPSINYVYATEAAGYFVELSLHSPWELDDKFTLTPYITQGFDFKYRTEKHNGVNHLQFGLEVSYRVTTAMALTGHVSHSLAQADIEQEALANGEANSQDQTYAGLHFNWRF